MGWRTNATGVVTACLFVAAGCGEVHQQAVDAPIVDMPEAHEVALSQAFSMGVTNGLACETNDTHYVRENSFYRAFPLAEFGVTGALRVKHVAFGVYMAASKSGQGQSVELRLYTYAGNPKGDYLVPAMMSLPLSIENANILIADTASPRVVDHDVSAVVPAGNSVLIAEIFAGDGVTAQNKLELGANTQGDRAPAYHRAALCNPTTMPTSFSIHPVYNGYSLVLSLAVDTSA